MSEPLWATGPGEILRHALSLLEDDTDANRRLAMISIDNSVELMLQTFIQLPKRVTGVDIPRSKRDEFCATFPKLLDGVEQCAPDRIASVDLGIIEWFHRLRNQLYHQGNGLTVERVKVEAYAELAKGLFEALYDTKLEVVETESMKSLGEFLNEWIKVERALQNAGPKEMPGSVSKRARHLHLEGKLEKDEVLELMELQKVRNQLVHGVQPADELVSSKLISRVAEFASKLGSII